MDSQLARLHKLIVERHNLEEFRTLCFQLDVKYDQLGGETLGAKARELILWLGRRRQLEQ